MVHPSDLSEANISGNELIDVRNEMVFLLFF